MLKKKSNPWARLKYLCILPVAALVVTGFARPELSYELNKFQNDEINDFTALVKTNLEKFEPIEKSGSPSSRKHIKEKRTIASETATDTSNITIIRLSDNSPEKQPLVIFDDKEIPYSSIKKLNQEKIQSISVIKDKTGVDLYGEKAKNGVIIIRMKKDTASITPGEKLKLKVSPIRNSNLLDKTLFFLDGKEISKSDFEKLRQDRIESLEILNNAQEFEEKNPTLYNKYKYKLNNNVLYRKTDIFLSDNLVVWYFPKDIRL